MQLISRLRSKTFRYIFLSLSAIYLLFSVGVIKATHLCMGREASVTYFSSESKKCACSIIAGEENHCCDDVNSIIRIENDHQSIEAYNVRVPELYILEDLYTERLITSLVPEHVTHQEARDTSPPPIPLFKTYCSFVFYDSEQAA